jgi:glycosyltransferase involved in cell wall biosynthesis
VITIFHNEERYLTEAIESVRAQVMTDWELLLVDDGSDDASPRIADGYAAADGRIRVLRHPGGRNRGMSASRNAGLAAARGALVALLDADDVFLPQKLSRQAAILAHHPEAQMVYGATTKWHSWRTGRGAGDDEVVPLGVPAERLYRPPELLAHYLRPGPGWPPATCSTLIRRAAVERVGGYEDEFGGLFEDRVFFSKVTASEPVFVESGRWDRYRQHPDSACQRAIATGESLPGTTSPAHRRYYEWLAAYLAEGHPGERELRRLVRARLRPFRHPHVTQARSLARGVRDRMRRSAPAEG